MTAEALFMAKMGTCAVSSSFLMVVEVAEKAAQPINQWIPVALAAIAAVSSYMALMQSRVNAKKQDVSDGKMNELHITVDGKLSKLVEATAKAERAAGKEAGRLEEKANAAIIAVAKADGKTESRAEEKEKHL